MPDFLNYLFVKSGLDVSRETREKFRRYTELLLKWQKVINLVSDASLEDMAERHFLDSAQLIKYIPNKQIKLVDMGSGAGFPGMVLSMLGMTDVHLIESDVRKATFLREVSRETNTPVTIHDDRVEDTKIPDIDVITARAMAPLQELLTLSDSISTEGHPFFCLLLKGEKAEEEIIKARKRWNFTLEMQQSITDKDGRVLKINNLEHK